MKIGTPYSYVRRSVGAVLPRPSSWLEQRLSLNPKTLKLLATTR